MGLRLAGLVQGQSGAECRQQLHQLLEVDQARVGLYLCDPGLAHSDQGSQLSLRQAMALSQRPQVLAELVLEANREGIGHRGNLYPKADIVNKQSVASNVALLAPANAVKRDTAARALPSSDSHRLAADGTQRRRWWAGSREAHAGPRDDCLGRRSDRDPGLRL